jgi:hypothetical protein
LESRFASRIGFVRGGLDKASWSVSVIEAGAEEGIARHLALPRVDVSSPLLVKKEQELVNGIAVAMIASNRWE